MFSLAAIQEAIRKADLSGWLFYSYHKNDPITAQILDIPADYMNARPFYYIVPSQGTPCKFVNPVEAGCLDHLPGDPVLCFSREQLCEHLRRAAVNLQSERGTAPIVAAQFSPVMPVMSYLDYGTALLMRECGFDLHPSAELVQRQFSLLDKDQIASHERAAEHLYAIVEGAWETVRRAAAAGTQLREGDVQQYILDQFTEHGLITDNPPIVGVGSHSADPHYDVRAEGAVIASEQIVQFDLWAREPDGIFADISWVGYTGKNVPEAAKKVFASLKKARDGAVTYIAEHLQPGNPLPGKDVDAYVRSLIIEDGYGDYLRHRTGHGIDTAVHGSGAGLDSVEFPDTRPLLEGSCFSVEPGLYLESFGLRTEIDVYIRDGRPVISGRKPQQTILHF